MCKIDTPGYPNEAYQKYAITRPSPNYHLKPGGSNLLGFIVVPATILLLHTICVRWRRLTVYGGSIMSVQSILFLSFQDAIRLTPDLWSSALGDFPIQKLALTHAKVTILRCPSQTSDKGELLFSLSPASHAPWPHEILCLFRTVLYSITALHVLSQWLAFALCTS